MVPEDVTTWDEVDYMVFPRPRDIPLQRYIDLRKEPFEKYQPYKIVPVMDDAVREWVVLPDVIYVEDAQRRIDAMSPRYHVWRLMVIGQSWIISVIPLPEDVQDIVYEHDRRLSREARYEALSRIGRGGARAAAVEPRTAMFTWATQKIARECPECQPRTAAVILRGETRVIAAVLNTRSAAQTREVMRAAYRRAAIPYPALQGEGNAPAGQQQQQQQEGQPAQQQQRANNEVAELRRQMDDTLQLMGNQNTILAQMMGDLSQNGILNQHMITVDVLQQHNSAQVAAIRRLTQAIVAVENRLARLEEGQQNPAATVERASLPPPPQQMPHFAMLVPQHPPQQHQAAAPSNQIPSMDLTNDGATTVVGDEDLQDSQMVEERAHEQEAREGEQEAPGDMMAGNEEGVEVRSVLEALRVRSDRAMAGRATAPFRSGR